MAEKRARRPSEETTPPAALEGHPARPPAPSQEARIDRYMKQASESMRRLSGFAGTVDHTLSSKSADDEQAPPPSPPPRAGSEPGPHLGGMLAAALRWYHPTTKRAATDAEFVEAATGNEVPEQTVGEGDFSAIPEFEALSDSRYQSYASDIADGWLPQIIGTDITPRMASTPAVLCSFAETDDMSANQLFLELQMIGSLGGYLVRTNAIVISDDILSYGEADARHVMLHELLHYASWLGGGRDIRWRDENGERFFQGDAPSWNMHEGLTELTAQEIVRERGFEPSRIGYPAETITCYYMEQLLGEGGRDMLRLAYLSGDFTEVRSRLDSTLGAGAFDALLAKRDAAQALSFLIGRLDELGADHSAWDVSPIVARARAKLEGGH